ncbi:hypothetical protein CROQUDRAFT_669200 [Cronartium quercuum f. sp. fusiforme G11]|uniref:Histone deacetylase complex subunit SAP18 n=1 Tax=Cronartium quercuum f. sp. fusiforme G11 TaxID=708437 RepID=A0A9P6TEG5_9BASI|nr:hypothetical protein CROQUDRAFT_669200 [Cronartium quercuum f. sp. fusiforme G11]
MLERTRNRPAPVDREKTCPFLLRVFVKPGSYHDIDREFQLPDRVPLPDESQLYAWKDTTLRDICLQLIENSPSVKLTPTIKFSIRQIFLDTRDSLSGPSAYHASGDGPLARYRSQELGVIFARDLARESASGPAPGAAARTLQELQFMVGDFLDVALLPVHPPIGPAFASTDARIGFGIRGAASGMSRPPSTALIDGPRWGRPGPSSGWGGAPSAQPRWGTAGDRRGSAFETTRSRGGPPPTGPDARRWGHNATSYNGAGDRDRFESRSYRGTNGNSRRRGDSRSRSPSPRRGGRQSPRR